MRQLGKWRRTAALFAVGALVLSACGGDDDDAGEQTETEAPGGDTEAPTEAGTGGTGGEVATGEGITAEPCPDAVNEDNGCIYLGILSDLTEGPFAPLGPSIVQAQEAFWNRVNEQGGIGGAYDVNVTEYTRDNKYNPEVHNQLYQEIKPNILAIAQTLGSPTTMAILDDMKSSNIVGAPASWTSLWEYEDALLESGAPYCVESMNGIDWWVEQGNEVDSVIGVGYPGDFGEDGAAGASIWASENGADFTFIEQIPVGAGGTVDGAVGTIVQQNPDVVVLTLAPTETAQIVGGAAANGYQGRFIGNGPSWNGALLQTPAADALKALYTLAGPFPTWSSDTPAHEGMREALSDVEQPNDGYTVGWFWSYPLKAALEAAYQAGDLTREGVVAAVGTLESVDYEGALPPEDGNFAGSPDEQFARHTYIGTPTEEEAAGVRTETIDGYMGPTAEGYTFEGGACYEVVDLRG